MGEWLRRLWYLLNRRRLEKELQQDMEAHREMLGAPHRFGNTLRLREDARDVWGWRWLDNISQDLRYAFRTIQRNPAFTAVVVISLGLGIGANTALFSVFDAKFFRRLPVKNPDELVMLKWRARSWRPDRLSGRLSMYDGSDGHEAMTTGWSFSPFALEKFRSEGQTLESLCAFTYPSDRTVIIDGAPDRVKVLSVSDNYFSTLGVKASAGRLIEPDASQAPVAVISHGFWQSRFAMSPAAIGKTVTLNGAHLTIIGVMPPDFNASLTITGAEPQVVVPMFAQAQIEGRPVEQDRWAFQIMARMKSGANLQQVRGNLEGLFQGIAEQSASNTSPRDIPQLIVESGRHGLDDRGLMVSDLLMNVTGAAGLLLLIVCLNVASLLMARSAAREYEIGIRLSMGASRRRVIRQLLTESLVLAAISAVFGILIAYSGKDILRVFLGAEMDLVQMDGHVLGFAILASMLTAILFGLAPALQATRLDLNSSIKKSARNAAGGRTRLNKVLLVVQVSGSVMLLVGAGLLLRTMSRVPQIDVGFNTNNLLLFQLETRGVNYPTERLIAICDEIQARINALPNVIAATSSATPLLGTMPAYELDVPGSPTHPSSSSVQWTDVQWNFPEIMGVPILRGRSFRQTDSRVAIINEKVVRTFFGDVDPIGRHIILYSIVRKEKVPTELEVIGVARDVGVRGSADDIRPTVFRSSQRSLPAFAVRTSVEPTSLMPAIREILRNVDAGLPVFDVKTESDAIKEGFANTHVLSVACGIFGGLALVLTCIGLYGLLSYTVTRRTNEIGIRMALGAQRVDVVRFVMAQIFALVIAGLLIGLAAARMMNEVIRSLVFGVNPFDAATIAGVVAIVLLMTSLSVFLPARRASRVDPTIALRQE